MSKQNVFDQAPQGVGIPFISLHGFLEDFMKNNSKKLRLFNFAENLNAVLEDCPPLAAHRVCYHCCRDKVVGMENHHIFRIIDNALSA